MRAFVSVVGIAAFSSMLPFETAISQTTGAEPPAMPEQCAVKSESNYISVVVCTEELDNETLAIAGQAACGDRIPCGAWIWPSEEHIPAQAPAAHDGLNQQQVTSATAVWVQEDQSLILIEELKK